jgi:hypothetical protein
MPYVYTHIKPWAARLIKGIPEKSAVILVALNRAGAKTYGEAERNIQWN